MNKALLLLVILSFSINVNAQQRYPTTKVAEEFMNRTLIVEISPESRKKGEKIEDVNNYYRLLKEVFKDWTLTPVVFKTEEEIDVIVKSKSKDYAILVSSFKMEETIKPGGFIKTEVFSLAIYLSEKGKKRDNYYIDISGERSIQRGPYVYNVSLNDRPQKYQEIEFAMNLFETDIPLALDKKILREKINELNRINVDKIINKTLLIPKEYLDLSETTIEELYPYKFEIVSQEEIDEYIEENNLEYIYFKYIFSTRIGFYLYAVIDIETNNILEEVPGFNNTAQTAMFMERDFKALGQFTINKSERYK